MARRSSDASNAKAANRKIHITKKLHRLSVIIGTRISTSRCFAAVVVSLLEDGMAMATVMEMKMEMTTFTSLRIPYRAAEKKEASVVPLRHRSIEQLLPFHLPVPFPFAPDAILFKSFYIRWPQSTPPHRPPSLLQRRGHHSALARLLPECTLLSSGVRPLPPPNSQLATLLIAHVQLVRSNLCCLWFLHLARFQFFCFCLA